MDTPKIHETQAFVDSTIYKEEKILVRWKDILRQMTAVCIAHCVVIPSGISIAFSSVLLPQLKASSELPITESQASWIASLVTITLPLGTILAGILMDKIGRKKTCIFTAIPFSVVWILTATASNVGTLYFARILTGITSGLTTTSLIYISEISHPNFRGMFLSFNSVYVSLGILLTCVQGYLMNWRTMCYVFLAVEIGIFLILFLIPESPHWFITFKQDREAATRSLRWLYTNNKIYENENHRLTTSVVQKGAIVNEFKFFHFNSYCSPIIYKPLIILSTLFIIQQCTGSYVITFYAIDIFKEVYGDSNDHDVAYIALVVLGVIRFIISVIGAIISKRVGRRYLLWASGAGMSVTSCIAFLYMYTKEHSLDYNGYIVLICILGYVLFGTFGYLVIPWTLISELLPVKARGKLGSLLIGLAYVYMFGVVKIFPFLLNVLDMKWILLGFCVVNIIGIFFVYWCLPETLGKRFSEIEEHFIPNI